MRMTISRRFPLFEYFFSHRFSSVLELADDNSIDYPMLWRYLADVITPVILADQFTLFDLKPLILEHLLPVGKAAALLAEILVVTKELKVSVRLGCFMID